MSSQALNWIRFIVLFACWGAFGVVWAVGAIYNAAKAPAIVRRGNPITVWIVGVVFALLLSALIPPRFWRPLTVHAAWIELLGAALLVASTAFILWARFVLGTMWTSNAAVKAGHVLHTEGPYAITRNPIYTGLLGMFLGTTLLNDLGVYLAYLVVVVVVLETKIHAEEQLLTAALGEQYLRYKQRVPQLIPGLNLLRRRDEYGAS
jgi:protein-S-isoprenylcysteine O-methyltransferase Ste14